jgi:hypothetical protein
MSKVMDAMVRIPLFIKDRNSLAMEQGSEAVDTPACSKMQ